MSIYKPFTYFIMWKHTNMKYYGVRYAKKRGGIANPSQLWETYFTSSKYVKKYRQKHGEPDIIKIHRVFDNAEEARNFEEKYLKKTKAKYKKDWLNKSDNKGQPILIGEDNPMFGKKSPEKSISGRKSIKDHQLNLSFNGTHPFQKEESRKKARERQLLLYENGMHFSQKKEYREKMKNKTTERNKTEKMKNVIRKRNSLMNSISHICPNCGKVGKGPNMKRYHFHNCKNKISNYNHVL